MGSHLTDGEAEAEGEDTMSEGLSSGLRGAGAPPGRQPAALEAPRPPGFSLGGENRDSPPLLGKWDPFSLPQSRLPGYVTDPRERLFSLQARPLPACPASPFSTFSSPKWVSSCAILVPGLSRTVSSPGGLGLKVCRGPGTQCPLMTRKRAFCPFPPWPARLALPILRMWPSRVTMQREGQSCHPGQRGCVCSDLGPVWTQQLRPRQADGCLCPVSSRMARRAPLCTGEASTSRLWGQEWDPSGLGRLVPRHPGKSLCLMEGGKRESEGSPRRWQTFHGQRQQDPQAPACCPVLPSPHPQLALIFQKCNRHFIYTLFSWMKEKSQPYRMNILDVGVTTITIHFVKRGHRCSEWDLADK